MNFNLIQKDSWDRIEYFEHYIHSVPCTYSMAVKLDISKIKQANMKLYPTMLYYLTTVVNQHSEFRMAIDANGQLGFYDEVHPCYTFFHKDTQTFSNLWTEYNSDIRFFCDSYNKDLSKYGDVHKMNAKPNTPRNCFSVSMIPWTSFEGFNLNLQKGYDYLLPIFTLGKYIEDNGKYLLPLAIQVHHAVCDGFHVSRFINELQELISNCER